MKMSQHILVLSWKQGFQGVFQAYMSNLRCIPFRSIRKAHPFQLYPNKSVFRSQAQCNPATQICCTQSQQPSYQPQPAYQPTYQPTYQPAPAPQPTYQQGSYQQPSYNVGPYTGPREFKVHFFSSKATQEIMKLAVRTFPVQYFAAKLSGYTVIF